MYTYYSDDPAFPFIMLLLEYQRLEAERKRFLRIKDNLNFRSTDVENLLSENPSFERTLSKYIKERMTSLNVSYNDAADIFREELLDGIDKKFCDKNVEILVKKYGLTYRQAKSLNFEKLLYNLINSTIDHIKEKNEPKIVPKQEPLCNIM